ncbi:MAG: T9SS type A sorting domain-containing protein, partial [Bacteroidetes bacterium]|nr:T9SS type A sorting domain-containing protein [Bacteroidota bacterium]
GDCAPLVLTATHVEPTNQTSNSTFSNWIFYFNYQTPTCSYSGAQPGSSQSITGATFKARASYDSASNKIAADYLIVQLSSQPPKSYNAYLAGWDRSNASVPLTGTFISFHHPGGDVKKVSTTSVIDPAGNFNGGGTNTHWSLEWLTGGTEEGSSGAALFNASGNEIGILSGGVTNTPSCTTPNSSGQEISDYAVYSKLAYDWNYTASGSTPLKSVLDPTGSGISALSGTTACATAIIPVPNTTSGIDIYPNPVHDILYAAINQQSAAQVHIEVYNAVGARIFSKEAQQSAPARYQLDLSNYPVGIYMLRILVNNTLTVKKITLSR